MLLYERVIAPVSPVIVTRGYERFEGLYADVLTYAIYIVGALLVAGYLMLDEESKEPFRIRARRMVLVSALAVTGLMSMQHTASWAVAATLLGLLFIHSIGKRQMPVMVFMLLVGLTGFLFVGDQIGDRISSALETDIAVYEGEKDVGRAFHGRVSRWQNYINYWESRPALDKMLGISLTSERPQPAMLGSGIHNDFMRVAFASGLIGLFAYLCIYIALFAKSWQGTKADRFLAWGAMAIMLLYSVTTTPTLYFPLLYLCLPVFAFTVIPKRRLKPERARQHVKKNTPLLPHSAPRPAGR
jgi:O-antigen ligase